MLGEGKRNVEANPKPHSETVKDDSGLLEDATKVDTDSIMQESRARLDTMNMARMTSWRSFSLKCRLEKVMLEKSFILA